MEKEAEGLEKLYREGQAIPLSATPAHRPFPSQLHNPVCSAML